VSGDRGPTLVPAPKRARVPPRREGVWYLRPDGQWSHRPLLKVLVNTVLRWLQPWTVRKWVIFTRCEDTERSDQPPRVLGYGFGRVLHLDNPDTDGDGQ
jgi:hypothetical protein